MDLVKHLERQRKWSEQTFGPGSRSIGVIAHIRKELVEIEENPTDLMEWIDVIILAFDGAWREGYDSQQICDALKAKHQINENRDWPNWRTMPVDGPIEHVR